MRSLPHRCQAMAHQDTADFIHAALTRLSSAAGVPPSSPSARLVATEARLYSPATLTAPHRFSRRLKPVGHARNPTGLLPSASISRQPPSPSERQPSTPTGFPQSPSYPGQQLPVGRGGGGATPAMRGRKTPRSPGQGSPPAKTKKRRTQSARDAAT
jgi:hypothetical protein